MLKIYQVDLPARVLSLTLGIGQGFLLPRCCPAQATDHMKIGWLLLNNARYRCYRGRLLSDYASEVLPQKIVSREWAVMQNADRFRLVIPFCNGIA